MISDLKLGSEVVVLNSEGIIEAEGEIEFIQFNRYSMSIKVNGSEFDISTYRSGNSVFDRESYYNHVESDVVKERASVESLMVKFFSSKLSPEQRKQVLQHIDAIGAIVKSVASEDDLDKTEPLIKYNGHAALDYDGIWEIESKNCASYQRRHFEQQLQEKLNE